MQAHFVVQPPSAELVRALSNLGIRIDDKKRATTVRRSPDCQCRPAKRANPMVDFCVVTAFEPAVVVIEYGAPACAEFTGLGQRQLLAESWRPPTPLTVVNEPIIRISKHEVSLGQSRQTIVKPKPARSASFRCG
ncbi:hypothetical protein NKH56_31085 [Mesorhizobium sp. M1076]|uniref:hypothetical protein n=1 Tax=Mesorhizobium sp. M1076 TaxID=2957054 RepID=UPI003339B188